jgi:murein DD-endopeptidase MepM/ murein hydrolase activator NlpD
MIIWRGKVLATPNSPLRKELDRLEGRTDTGESARATIAFPMLKRYNSPAHPNTFFRRQVDPEVPKRVSVISLRTGSHRNTEVRSSPAKLWIACLACVALGILIGLHRTPPPARVPGTFLASPSLGKLVPAQVLIPDKPDISTARMMPDGTVPGYSLPEVRLVKYTVRPGDTLSAIAAKYNTTPSSISYLNNLASPDLITVGKELSIMQNASGVVVKVSQGDTLWDISRRYGVSVSDIVQANKLSDGDVISPGMTLLLPGASTSARPLPLVSRSSSFSWPIRGSLTSSYGWRVHPISGVNSFHDGLDIAAASGTAIAASASGRVEFAGWLGGYGRLVIVDHGDGVETRYAHMSGFAVSEGDWVAAGDTVGYVGQSGDATGPHVHFEIRKSGRTVNPRDYLP